MKAVCFTAFGAPDDVLSLKTIPKPAVEKPEEILIKVCACSLNPIDKYRVAGGLTSFLPEAYNTGVVGYDVAGIVEEVGSEVTAFAEGDEVYVRLSGMKFGALAEYVICEPDEVAKKPTNMSFSEAASIPLVGLTAFQVLQAGGVKEGSKVFIPGGAGGVGSIGIQIAKKMLKASYVCTTASPGRGTEMSETAGADRVINYREEDFEEVLAGEDFDFAFDTMNQAHKMGSILKKGGKIISITGSYNNPAAESAAKAAGGTWTFMLMHPSGSDLAEIASSIEAGDIKAFLDVEAASLEDYKVAVDKLWSGRSKGKCVIKVA